MSHLGSGYRGRFSPDQREALSAIDRNKYVVVTGQGGSGKSHIMGWKISELLKLAKEQRRTPSGKQTAVYLLTRDALPCDKWRGKYGTKWTCMTIAAFTGMRPQMKRVPDKVTSSDDDAEVGYMIEEF